jgi:hypothetical protein
MNYTKPEVAVLGQAVRVIEGYSSKQTFGPIDNVLKQTKLPPAYDLDE